MLAGLTATEMSNKCVVGVCRQKVRRVDFDSATPIISPATFGVTPLLHSPNWSSSVDNLEWVPETASQCLQVNISFGLACFPR